MSIVIALDLGTTGNRAIAYSADGHVLASAYKELALATPKPGWVEQNPEDIISGALEVLKSVLSQVDATQVVSIGLTNQRETTIVWDKESGTPLYPAIVWQDRRTADFCAENQDKKSWIKAKTGLFLDPYFSATKLKWILDTTPGSREKAQSGDSLFGTVDTWVLWHLTGRKSHATDVSNASRTLLFNTTTLDYDTELLSFFDIPLPCLPTVKETVDDFGETDASVVGYSFPIRTVIGDQQAALYAQCGPQKGEIKNTYGTGLFVMANAGDTVPESETLIGTIAWSIGGKVSYALEGSIFVGGSAIQWLRDGLGVIDSAEASEALALSVEDSDGVRVVPAFTGLGAPHWRPDARGSIMGLTRGSTQAHIVRATLESLAFQSKEVIDEMDKVLGYNSKQLKTDGGATHNRFLMQFQADCLQKTVLRAKMSDSTALGVAGLLGIDKGLWTDAEFRSLFAQYTEFTPCATDYVSEFESWRQAVRATLLA